MLAEAAFEFLGSYLANVAVGETRPARCRAQMRCTIRTNAPPATLPKPRIPNVAGSKRPQPFGGSARKEWIVQNPVPAAHLVEPRNSGHLDSREDRILGKPSRLLESLPRDLS